MSLRSTFRPAELGELQRRLQRLRRREPETWLDDFPEFWLEKGATWHRSENGPAIEIWALNGHAERCAHLFEPLRAEPGAWSYLCASFLHRAILSVPAPPAAAAWLVAAPHFDLLRAIRAPSDVPADWRPHVVEDNTRVSVRWYTAKPSELAVHEDIYRSEGFDFETTERLLARALGC